MKNKYGRGIFILTILVLSFCVFNLAKADTYWVSPEGRASWSDCRGPNPLNGVSACNISVANQNAVAGDTVYLRGGNYTSDTVRDADFIYPLNSGTESAPIIFSAYQGEKVIVNFQKLANGDQENGPWESLDGAVVSSDSSNVYEGNYSTRFTTESSGQGIKSSNFTFYAKRAGELYYLILRVFSDKSKVNIYVQDGDGLGPAVDKDVNIIPNMWQRIGMMIPSSGDPGYGRNIGGDKAYVAIRSPSDISNGTWYVDDVRLHSYGKAAILLSNVDYIIVDGINSENVDRGFIIMRGSDYNEIRNSSFSKMGMLYSFGPCIIMDDFNTGYQPSTYNWIHHNVFHESGYISYKDLDPTQGKNCNDEGNILIIGYGVHRTADGQYIPDRSSYNLIENNIFYHGAHDLVIIRSTRNVIRDNIFHNEGWIRNDIYSCGGCQDADGDPNTLNNPLKFGNRNLLFENDRNFGGYTLVEGNYIGFAGTPPDDDGSSGIENPADGNIIRFNYIYKNGGSGIFFKGQPGISGVDVVPDYNKVYHNTIYANGWGDSIGEALQGGIFRIYYSWTNPDRPIGNTIKNNIVFGNRHALTGWDWQGYTYINNLEEDPLFNNPDTTDPMSINLPDLRIQSGSPAIDKAVELTRVASEDTGSGLELKVEDAGYFQDGSWGPKDKVQADWIAVGRVDNAVQIESINYETNTITLKNPISRNKGDPIWLYKDSTGRRVLYGSAPDIGAYEYSSGFLYGDISGDNQISAYDAALAAQYSVGLISLTQEQIQKADVSGDKQVTAYDAALIAQRAVGLIGKFPVEG